MQPPDTRTSNAGADALSPQQWKEATRFDGTDIGWIFMSIGMAIGAGIVFLPVQVGLMGVWVFLLSAVVGYPGMYLFQRLFINTLASARVSQTYPDMISSYLGRGWGTLLGALYFVMLVIWMFVYATAITRDSASYLHSFGITQHLLSNYAWYPLILLTVLVGLASRGEKLLFRMSSFMVITKLLIVAAMGVFMIPRWNTANLGALPPVGTLITKAVITLPFTLTSILFIQTLSPMVISYRAREKSPEVARYKALRAMNIAFAILFVTVFFYAISFTLAMKPSDAIAAYQQNISALAIIAQVFPASSISLIGVILNLFAVMTAFFGVYLGFREASVGIFSSMLGHWVKPGHLHRNWIQYGVMGFAILLSWGAVVANLPVLSFTTFSSPIFGIIGCLLPVWLVIKTPDLSKYRKPSLIFITLIGILLCISPFLAWM
ncbi:aromatic amino acid transport family protein [Acetobacter pasteurianus]|uniref:Inner membrane transport protein n=1 Tax=Acetobacter pasteurianus subsp. pasteurianus TaxID=481145 RepID=A0A1Y0Y8Z1_ACEPA|nr:aromatic amino acid transport family protein [Acetobacter pasteurianus]ARW48917.1 Inner membrane transport protein [Acetobacter pasteurianus subsp. pasteurianus]